MEVHEIDIAAILKKIAAGETTVEDARILAYILEPLGLLPSTDHMLEVE